MRTRVLLLLAALAAACAVASGLGCARWPDGGGGNLSPDRIMRIQVSLSDAVRSAYYYYIAFATSGDERTGPLPIDRGPFWGNGWGTGVIDFYIVYHAGQYKVFRPRVLSALTSRRGGFEAVIGNPTTPIVGTHRLTVDGVTLGAVAIEGAGTVTSATSLSSQNAGVVALTTDAAGRTVAGTVSFTPAEHGGRALTSAEQAALDALNAGGVTLNASSLSALGLSLTLGAPTAGSQTLTVAPARAQITDRFASYFGLNDSVSSGELLANDTAQGPTPPILGVQFTTSTIEAGTVVEVVTQFDATPDEMPPPYLSVQPGDLSSDDRMLDVTLDLAQLGDPTGEIRMNVITTDQLELDPEVLSSKSYDGLGSDGTSFVTLSLDQNRTFYNSQAIIPEFANDVTIGELSSAQFQPGEIDVVDWEVDMQIREGGESGES